MITRASILFGALLALAACDKDGGTTKPAADNTKINERDRQNNALTPGDQAENEVDRTITQKIRQGVMKNDTLSMSAKNVKIITANSIVTLRGPVKSDKEKADIAAIAQGTEGVTRVDNQLEIAAN
jgi:hyperosmotically inducible protein